MRCCQAWAAIGLSTDQVDPEVQAILGEEQPPELSIEARERLLIMASKSAEVEQKKGEQHEMADQQHARSRSVATQA